MKNVKTIVGVITLIIIAVIIGIVLKQNMVSNEYELQKIEKFSYFKLYENKKYGVIDDKGSILIEPIYDAVNIPNPTKDVFVCYTNNGTDEYKTKILNEKNQEVLTEYEQVLPIACEQSTSNIPFEKSVLKYRENGKYGIIDFTGKKITNADYDAIESLEYREGCLKVKQDDKYGIINITGKKIIDTKYDDIKSDEYYTKENEYMDAGFIVQTKTEEGYRYGYINKNGKETVNVEYNEINRITEIEDDNAYLLFSKNGRYGLLKNDRIIIDNAFETIDYNKDNNVFLVQKNSKQGVISTEGKEILPMEYDSILCSGTRIITRKGESIETYNSNGDRLDYKYDNTIETSNEDYMIKIDENSKFGVVSKRGQTLIKNEYDNLEYAFNDIFIATQNGKVGVIDINKGTVVDFKYDIIQKVKEKNVLQAITTNINTIEIYNSNGERTISIKDAIIYIFDNYIKLISENDMQYLDNNGNILSNKEIFTDNKLFSYYKNGKWGFIDSQDNIVVPTQYDLVTEFSQYGYAGIKKDNKWGVIDQTGNIIVMPSYTINWNEPEFIDKYCKSNFGYGFEYYTDELTK